MPQRAEAEAGAVVGIAPCDLAEPLDLSIKRGFDLVIAAAVVVMLIPLIALIALVIRLDSPGPCSTGSNGWVAIALSSAA